TFIIKTATDIKSTTDYVYDRYFRDVTVAGLQHPVTPSSAAAAAATPPRRRHHRRAAQPRLHRQQSANAREESEDDEACDADGSGFITISFLSDKDRTESVALVRQHGCSRARRPQDSSSPAERYRQKLCDDASSRWLSLRRLHQLKSTESADQQQQQLRNRDFLSSLIDKLSGSLSGVGSAESDSSPASRRSTDFNRQPSQNSQQQQQLEDPQQLLTYRLFNKTRPRRFKDSPPAAAAADAGSDSGADGAPAEAVGSEDAGLARSEEAPDIVRFLLDRQAKCWPDPVSNGSVTHF
uniref:CG5993 n=1 Tax=Macrostomum lignano TaxID=282301 RepID=A0A1I8I0E7_9PLAT